MKHYHQAYRIHDSTLLMLCLPLFQQQLICPCRLSNPRHRSRSTPGRRLRWDSRVLTLRELHRLLNAPADQGGEMGMVLVTGISPRNILLA